MADRSGSEVQLLSGMRKMPMARGRFECTQGMEWRKLSQGCGLSTKASVMMNLIHQIAEIYALVKFLRG